MIIFFVSISLILFYITFLIACWKYQSNDNRLDIQPRYVSPQYLYQAACDTYCPPNQRRRLLSPPIGGGTPAIYATMFRFDEIYYNEIESSVCGRIKVTTKFDTLTPQPIGGEIICFSLTAAVSTPTTQSEIPLQVSNLAPQQSYSQGKNTIPFAVGRYSNTDGNINSICSGLCSAGRFGNKASIDDQCTNVCPSVHFVH